MMEDKVAETTGKRLINLLSITEIINEESITEVSEENSKAMNLIYPTCKFWESRKWCEKKRNKKAEKVMKNNFNHSGENGNLPWSEKKKKDKT